MVASQENEHSSRNGRPLRHYIVCFSILCIAFPVILSLWQFRYSVKEFSVRRSVLFVAKIVQSYNGHATFDDLREYYSVAMTTKRPIAWRNVGFRILRSFPGNLLVGQTTFRGDAKHEKEIVALNIKHVGGDEYQTEFSPSFAGVYNVSILVTYVNGEQFNFTRHVKARMISIKGSPILFSVEDQPPPATILRYCSRGESGTASGRWVKCGALKGIEPCNRWQLNTKYDFDEIHGFFWLPYTCQHHFYSDREMKECLARNGWNKIIFSGDSQTRSRAFHWATRLYGACPNCKQSHSGGRFDRAPKMEWVFDARGTRLPATFPHSVRRPKEIYIRPQTRSPSFSDGLPNSTLDGDLFLLNFGQWLMREMTFEKFMKSKVDSFIRGVKILKGTVGRTLKPKKFLWVNTYSQIWREDGIIQKEIVTPSPSASDYLNSVTEREMKVAGIQVVDAYQISNPRLGAAHDLTHYARVFPNGVCAGVVENAVTNVILNALCNKRL